MQTTDKKKVIVICGPTASGKTDLGIALSDFIDIEIISADSRQIYKLLDIGTAKPTQEELSKVKHYFIDMLMPDQEYNAGRYGDDAYQVLNQITANNKVPVIVGGSGLYIKSLCEGLFDDSADTDAEIYKKQREILIEELSSKGIDYLYSQLKDIDYNSYTAYADKNPRHVLRALEYYRATGKIFSEAHKDNKIQRDITPYYFCIDFPREFLYNRINSRVLKMIELGLIDEVKSVLNKGYDKNLNSLNTVGYSEIIKYLDGEYSLDEAISEIQKNTRHYAKRQLTWFRKVPNIYYIPSKYSISEMCSVILTEFNKN